MNIEEDSVAYEKLRQLESVAKEGCRNGPYLVEGSAAAGRFLIHTEASDSILLACEREGSEIVIAVTAFTPGGIRDIYRRSYVATERGLQHPTETNILMTPKEVMNSAFDSFESRLRVS
jgi:hypothetical protein